MGRRQRFWESVAGPEGPNWPVSHEERATLARAMLGATIVGAAESVVADFVPKLQGANTRAEVERQLAEFTHQLLYWVFIKASNSAAGELFLTTKCAPENGNSIADELEINGELELRWLVTAWLEDYTELPGSTSQD